MLCRYIDAKHYDYFFSLLFFHFQQTDDPPRKVDPEGSWLSFVRHSSRTSGSSTSTSTSTSSKKKCEKKNKDKSRNSRRLPEADGPAGPPGPQGPAGPAGAQITKQELLTEFRELIREAAERRAQIIIGEKCPSCLLNITEGTELHLPNLEELELLPTLPIAFHCKLSRDLDIPGKSLIEVVNFRTPMDTGSFRRGRGLDVRSGRFTAPRTAIYQLSANLHIGQRLSDVKSRELKPRDNVRLLICINSMCQRHTSLEFVSGMESNSRVFTVAVSGLLRLEEGQYASVYIDNSSGRRIEIQVGSDYSGVLMGV
ncbi:adipolin [Strongylocentrotus purpuratus]|uniref:Adipolin n=1 Tax=Strongylocentrotus purpuratus TaxID=7668 RepID=A0A7M7NYV6_STRPU|nr:adipolin [Strongylocentrotus purpuratus]